MQCKQIEKKQWREECLRYTTVADDVNGYLTNLIIDGVCLKFKEIGHKKRLKIPQG